MMRKIAIVGVMAGMACAAMSFATSSARAAAVEIQTEDVARFYKLYETTGGRPTVEQIQHDYLDQATAGLRHLTQVRNVNAENIARATATTPELYTNARSCMAALPRVRERLNRSFDKLLALYPEAKRPPVTILVSRGKPVAIGGPGDGVQISLEAACSTNAARFLGADMDDRFVRLIAHEYIHVQQSPVLAATEKLTVVERSLIEGVAEFIAEVIAGRPSNVGVFASVAGREREIETNFVPDVDKTDLSAWFDNTTAENVGQLGYWVGYRIAKSYYQHAPNKRAAIREMIQMTDAKAFLAASGWRPGIKLN